MTQRTKLEDLLTAAGLDYPVVFDGPGEDCPLGGGDPAGEVPAPAPARALPGDHFGSGPPSASPVPRLSEASGRPGEERKPPTRQRSAP